MSLIADALRRAQSSKLARRYRAPDPAGALPGAAESRRDGRRDSFGSLLRQVNLSPALLVGLGSGILLFVLLFAYFFYGQGSKVRSPVAGPSTAASGKPTGLVLTRPPSVPAVEPLIVEGEELTRQGLKAKEAPVENSISIDRAYEPRERAKSGVAKAERKTKEAARAGELKKSRPTSQIAGSTDLSEEGRYHFHLALSYQEETNFPLARREYETVVQAWPLYAEAHNNLGVVYKELGMYDQAMTELKKALALNPNYPRAYHNLGVLYQVKGDWQQATKNYEMALSLDRYHVGSYNNLGLVYRSEKRSHEAREILEKALAIDPALPQTHYNLALVLEELGELDSARFHYQKFIDLAKDENHRLVETVRAHLQGLTRNR